MQPLHPVGNYIPTRVTHSGSILAINMYLTRRVDMKKQFLSLAIALPIVLLSTAKSLAVTFTIAQVQAHAPHLGVSTPSLVSKASCHLSRSCSKKPERQKVVSQPTPAPSPSPTDPPCPLPRRC